MVDSLRVSDPAGRPAVLLDAFALSDPARAAGSGLVSQIQPRPLDTPGVDQQAEAGGSAARTVTVTIVDASMGGGGSVAPLFRLVWNRSLSADLGEGGVGGPSGAARSDRTDDAAAGREPLAGGLRLGGPRSGFVAVERGWRQPPPGESRPVSTAGAGSREAGADAERGREGSAWDNESRR